jgi:DNA-binding transcriptional ArsR family regulator
MNVATRTANAAKLISEPARAQMLIALLDGRAMTATELAHGANVSPQTASSHLSQMMAGELLALEKQGRHRYYRLASLEVATALEALMSLTSERVEVQSNTLESIHLARSCYDHVAGRVGVALADALQAKGWLATTEKSYEVTAGGEAAFTEFGIDLAALRKQRRHFARQCLDWTERRHHVAGALGAALMVRLLERGWLKKDLGDRVLRVTGAGYEGLERVLGVRV